MQNGGRENGRWPFDVSKTKLSERFMAGRGKVLSNFSKWPLEAQEFAKRKRVQEMIVKGEIKLQQGQISEELLGFTRSLTDNENEEIKFPNHSRVYLKEDLPSRNYHTQNPMSSSKTSAASAAGVGMNSTGPNELYGNSEVGNEKKKFQTNNMEQNYAPRDSLPNSTNSRKSVTKPLRKPEKSRKQLCETDTRYMKSNNIVQSKCKPSGIQSAWMDWENNVVVQGSLDDEDLPGIATLEDNDDLNDVIVNQYVDALQNQSNNRAQPQSNHKLTPHRVQQLSKLKSTANADCLQMSPGTQPNLPKGEDRWGGSELKTVDSNAGWGVPEREDRNRYDDGSSMWSDGGSQYGGISWSNTC